MKMNSQTAHSLGVNVDPHTGCLGKTCRHPCDDGLPHERFSMTALVGGFHDCRGGWTNTDTGEVS